MAGARLTRREALATVAAVVGLTALAGCAPSWLDMDSELTERDLEVARNLGKSEDEIESMRESGRAGSDVRGAEAAEDYLAERYGERFRAVDAVTQYASAISPDRVSVTLVVESGPATDAECSAVYRLGDDPDWSDDYVSVRLDAQLRVVAAEAFSKGFGDLAEGEVVWGSEVSRTSFYAEPGDGDKAIDPEASLANPGAALLPKFDVFASPTTSLTEEGLAERLESAADVFRSRQVRVVLRAGRVTTPVDDEGFTKDWAFVEARLGNYDWYCFVDIGMEGDS